jgi:hypothetical protein
MRTRPSDRCRDLRTSNPPGATVTIPPGEVLATLQSEKIFRDNLAVFTNRPLKNVEYVTKNWGDASDPDLPAIVHRLWQALLDKCSSAAVPHFADPKYDVWLARPESDGATTPFPAVTPGCRGRSNC